MYFLSAKSKYFALFSTVTVIVFPVKFMLAPSWLFSIIAFEIVYVLFLNSFVTFTVIGEVIIFSYPSGAFVSSIVIVSVPACVIFIGPIFISPFALVVSVTVPLGLTILNVAPCNFLLTFPCSTFTSFKLYEPDFGKVASSSPLNEFCVLSISTIGCTVLSPAFVQYVAWVNV